MLPDVDLEIALAPALEIVEEKDRFQASLGLHRFQLGDIPDCGRRIGGGPVFRGEGTRVVLGHAPGFVRRTYFGEQVTHLVEPRPREAHHRGLQVAPLDFGDSLGWASQIEVQARLVPGAHGQVVVEDLGGVAAHQPGFEFPPKTARKTVSREHHHDRHAATQGVPAHCDEHLRRVVADQNRADFLRDLVRRGEEEFLLRQGAEDRDRLLVVVRSFRETGPRQNGGELLAQNRDVLRRLGVRLRGEEPEEAVFTRH